MPQKYSFYRPKKSLLSKEGFLNFDE